jgi:hypothetical protein
VVKANQAVQVQVNQTTAVGKNQDVSVQGNQSNMVVGNVTQSVGGILKEKTGADHRESIGGNHTSTVSGDEKKQYCRQATQFCAGWAQVQCHRQRCFGSYRQGDHLCRAGVQRIDAHFVFGAMSHAQSQGVGYR